MGFNQKAMLLKEIIIMKKYYIDSIQHWQRKAGLQDNCIHVSGCTWSERKRKENVKCMKRGVWDLGFREESWSEWEELRASLGCICGSASLELVWLTVGEQGCRGQPKGTTLAATLWSCWWGWSGTKADGQHPGKRFNSVGVRKRGWKQIATPIWTNHLGTKGHLDDWCSWKR